MYTLRVHKKNLKPTRVGVRSFRKELSFYLRRAHEGEVIQVTSRDTVVAEIGPPAATPVPRRKFGALKGRIRVGRDFNAPLPNDLLDQFER